MARERDSPEGVRSGGLIGIKPPDVSPSEESRSTAFQWWNRRQCKQHLSHIANRGAPKKSEDRLSRSLRFIRRPKPEQKLATVDINGEI